MPKLFKSPDNIIKYLTAAVLMVIILYPKFPFIRLPRLQVSIRLEDFLMVAVAAVLGVYLLPRLRQIFSLKIEKAILIYLGVGFVSLLSAAFLTKTVSPSEGILHWVRRIEYFIPFFLGVLGVRKRQNLEFYLKVIMITLLGVLIYGLGQRYLSWPIIVTQNLEYAKGIALRWIPGSHINSTFAGHYDLATYLVLVLPILISLIFLLKGTKIRIILASLCVGGLWLLSAAVSRISIVSYLLAICVALTILKKYGQILVVVVLSILFFSFSSSLLARYQRVIQVIQMGVREQKILMIRGDLSVYAQDKDMQTTKPVIATPTPAPKPVFEDRSSSIRINVEWPRAVRALGKNPLLGTGYSSITLATDNDYLRALGEVGLLGSLAYALIFLRIFQHIVARLHSAWFVSGNIEKGFLAGAIGAVPGVLLNAVFIDVFEASKFAIVFWLFMGLLVGLIRNISYDE